MKTDFRIRLAGRMRRGNELGEWQEFRLCHKKVVLVILAEDGDMTPEYRFVLAGCER